MKTGTKLANNPNYGRPSGSKLHARIQGWKLWAQGMTMLRSIHAEIADKLNAKDQANEMLQRSTEFTKVAA